jgi:membrane protein DedA with SNARE-associated domain
VDVFLSRWGAACIFLTRWLITPLGIPVNVGAGINGYTFKKFVVWCFVGEFLWSFVYIYLGHILGTNWILIADYTTNAPSLLAYSIIGGGSLVISYKLWKKHRAK